jgi:hypothetical protein
MIVRVAAAYRLEALTEGRMATTRTATTRTATTRMAYPSLSL